MADPFFTKLKERNVFKVGVAYLVLTWVVVQVTSEAVPALHLPDWVNTFVFFIGAIGFPFAIFFAWAFEITPDGIKKETDLSSEEAVFAHSGRKLDFIIIGLMAVALGYFIYESRFQTQPIEAVIEESSGETAQQEISTKEPVKPSIAVLPFVNMSSDSEQEYFSDGISEEILNVLSKIPNLHVTSRSSSFSFKGKDIDLKKVAKQLGVNHILEGSVRKSGTKVRITAQLIETSSDRHLWSETYDRELTDVFAIQDELSAAIVAVLKIKLMGDSTALKAVMHKVTPEAHTAFLKGLHYLNNSKSNDEIQTTLKYFNDAILLDNNYALAHAYRGIVLNILTKVDRISRTEGPQIARMAIERAIEIDPELAIAYQYLALNKLWFDFDSKGSRLDLEFALTLNPNIAELYGVLSNLQSMQGKHRQALLYAQKAESLDPVHRFLLGVVSRAYFYQGDYQQALAEVEKALTILPDLSHLLLLNARVELAIGNYEQALLISNKMLDRETVPMIRSMAYSKMGDKTKSDEELDTAIKLAAHHSAFGIALVYCFRDEVEQCLDWLDIAYKQKDAAILRITMSPFLKPVYQEKRYKELVLKMNIY